MEIKSDKISFVEEKIEYNGLREKRLVIDCQNCAYFIKKSKFSNDCIRCLLKFIDKCKNLSSSKISIQYKDKLFRSGEIENLKSYFLNQDKIIKIWVKIKAFKKCKYKEFDCKSVISLKSIIMDLEKFFDDPIQFYEKITEIKNTLDTNNIYDSDCESCLINLRQYLNKILDILNKLLVIKEYEKYISKSKTHNRIGYYQQLFKKSDIKPERTFEIINPQNYEALTSYSIGIKSEFEVIIYKLQNELEKFYNYNLNISKDLNEEYLRNLINDINANFGLIEIDEIIPFEELVRIYTKKALSYIKSKYNFSNLKASKLALYASLKRINMFKLYPFLIDDYVEEIFLDSPNEQIYLNHQHFGRCRTIIFFSDTEIERLKTFLRIYSGKRLDISNPSSKLIIKNKIFYCRFAIDISPIALNGFALDIRKLNKNIMTIQDMLKNNTLNPKMAAFLYFNILRRVNITVTGETNTGKTTLINALDLITPKDFRKIYVEDINESINQSRYGRHQLKFQVESSDSPNLKFSKHNQIKNLLHRTPDIIYLGEVLTNDEAKAMFHCLAAGLKGFQTIHANDIESLINRFLYHFKIDRSCLRDLEIIILMKNSNNQRKVVSLSEIDDDNTNIYELFSYDPELMRYKLKSNLFESKTIIKLKRYENISKEFFLFFINLYEDIFTTLSKTKKLTNQEFVQFFDNISYLSLHSYQEIETYWSNWKKRNLNYLN